MCGAWHAQVYHQECDPVEAYYRAAGTLVDYEITAGIPETLPGLMALLNRYAPAGRQVAVPPPPAVSAAEARIRKERAAASEGQQQQAPVAATA